MKLVLLATPSFLNYTIDILDRMYARWKMYQEPHLLEPAADHSN